MCPPPALVALALLAAEPDGSAAAARDPGVRCSAFDLSLAGLGSLEEDLGRTAALDGTAPMWPGLVRRPSGARPLWLCDGPAPSPDAVPDPAPSPALRLEVVPPRTITKLLSGWADDRNDGALFAGRGLSASISTGLRARWQWFTAQVAPLAAWQENRGWPAPAAGFSGLSPYANPFHRGQIDLPLRMGPSAFSTFDWGTSFLRADLGPFAAGLSNENLWWGPGLRNAMLLTDTGPGFPHLFAGTSRPLDVWVGWIEAEAFWGQLRPSRWFDGDTRGRRLFQGSVFTFAPAFQRNLTVGFGRVWIYPGRDVNRDAYLQPLFPFARLFVTGRANGNENGLAAFIGRWAFPEVGFEIYGEFARDDFATSTKGLFSDPYNASAWVLGLQKVFRLGRGMVRAQLELAQTFRVPGPNPSSNVLFYTHSLERHGYTHGGQMLGASLGPQGDEGFLALDWLRGPWRLGVYVDRRERNAQYYLEVVDPAPRPEGAPWPAHDLAMTYGLRGAIALREWDVSADLAGAHRYNRDFTGPASSAELQLRVAWWPGRREAPALGR